MPTYESMKKHPQKQNTTFKLSASFDFMYCWCLNEKLILTLLVLTILRIFLKQNPI